MSTKTRGYNVYQQLTACRVVSTSNLTGTYFNGSSNTGIGATITALAVGVLTIDSVNLVLGNRVLLVGQSSGFANGIYMLTTEGTATVAAILTRTDDFDTVDTIKAGWFVPVGAGTTNAGAIYTVVEPTPQAIGTDTITFDRDSASGLGTAAAKAASDNSQPTLASVSGVTVTGNIAQFNDTAGTVTEGPVAGNKVLTSAIATPDVGPNLVSFNVTVGQAALATAGHVALITSSGSKQYKIKQLQLNSGGTNFSGGGGDRLGQVTDGTTVYSVVPAATMQTLANAQWGATALPNPASAAINTSTVAGTNLYFAYSGGATDYTAGSLVISGLAERVA